jgi:tellurite resistance protein TehA-like permease
MEPTEAFNKFLTTQSVQVSFVSFIINLALTGIVALLLKYVYVKYGKSLSQRERFSSNFLMLAMTTMVVITIVKSSLALSLGLVGALSIVRFRSAVKEPEELNYLFLAIASGLGFGANQTVLTLVAFSVILPAIVGINKFQKDAQPVFQAGNAILSISTKNIAALDAEKLIEILKSRTQFVNLKRIDEEELSVEYVFEIQVPDIEKLSSLKSDIRAIDKTIAIHFFENQIL